MTDPKELVSAVNDIREALVFSRIENAPSIERSNKLYYAAARACNALRELVDGDPEYWKTLEKFGPRSAAQLADLWKIRDNFDRATIDKIGGFLVAVGFKPPEEAYGFVDNAISTIARGVAYPQKDWERRNAEMAYISAKNLKDEVCWKADEYNKIAEHIRWRNALGQSALKGVLGAVKKVLTGGILGFASVPNLYERFPLLGLAESFQFSEQERLMAAAVAIDNIISASSSDG